MQIKIAKRLCFLLAIISLLTFIFLNSCKKVDDANQNPVIPRVDSTKNSVDTTISCIITGTVVDCNNNLVKSGNIILEEYNFLDQKRYESPINADGTFNFNFTVYKTDSIPVIIYAEDPSGQQIGNRVYFSLHSPGNNIGKITACTNTDTSQFLKITLDTSEHTYYFPDNPNSHPENPIWTFITAGDPMKGETQIYFGIDGLLAVGKPGLSLVEFDIDPGYGEHPETPPVVIITEYGPIGGYIAGNIKLKLETSDDTHSIHDATCSFRVKRKQ